MLKGLPLSLMVAWVLGSTAYQTLVLGVPKAELMGGIAVLALLMRYKDGDANVRRVWPCSRNDELGTTWW